MHRDDAHICLAPISRTTNALTVSVPTLSIDISKLTLQFELEKPTLGDRDVENFSKATAEACGDGPLEIRFLDWKGICRNTELRQEVHEKARADAEKASLGIQRFSVSHSPVWVATHL